MKTQGMAHQLEGLRLSNGREFFAYLMEQGTGKTWTTLADAERAYAAGTIDALCVIAPKGVHTNWTRREIPEHLSCEWTGGAYESGAGKRARAALENALFRVRDEGEVPPLRVLTINIDALLGDEGFTLVTRFINATRCMLVVDESSDIKNPDAARTKRIMRLKPRTVMRRILNGTPITNSPGDAFAQFEFLEDGLLGTTSYRAFYAEYTDLIPMNDQRLKAEGNWGMAQRLQRNPKLKYAQVPRRDESGAPMYRNLDKLQGLVKKHSYRVLKKECLDLPEKIYQTIFFEMEPAQRRAYESVQEDARLEFDDETITFSPLAVLTKMQQVTSGFVMVEGEPVMLPNSPGAKVRLAALMRAVEHANGKMIIWAKFREELAQIAAALTEAEISFVEYHGGVKRDMREIAVDEFQRGEARVFLGQPRAGGIGLTLTAAETMIYYSNDFNLRTRLQSEDRAHRIGTKVNVVYIDLVATGTIDESIARALQRKTAVAQQILGDTGLKFNEEDLARNEDDVVLVGSVQEARAAGDDAVVVLDPPVAASFIDQNDAASSLQEWTVASTRTRR